MCSLFSLMPLLFALMTGEALPSRYDIVIKGGRVMDPETGLDAVRHVGITGDRIARISSLPLEGEKIIDATGLIVAPGFVDLHQHGHDSDSYRLKALDGVTTALEMEIGVPDVAQFLQERRGRALINYGSTASHSAARAAAFGVPLPAARAAAVGVRLPAGGLVPQSGPATNEPATSEQLEHMGDSLRAELDAGALGIGMGIAYVPGATRSEVIEIFRIAAERSVSIYAHVRSAGRVEPGSSIEAISEVIAAAAVSGASLHIVHINSSCLKDAVPCLRLIEGARARGLDVTTEGYPYRAGMTSINSALFNPGWREKFGIDYKDLRLPDTGEPLTKESFERLHASPEPRTVLILLNPDMIVDTVILHPLVMIASDGLTDHPRNAGTYARVIARYVRSQQRLTLMDAIRKMSLMPAMRLERATSAARKKGRLQEGADADIVVFDSRTIADRATYESPSEPSVGVKYLLVAGKIVVDRGKILPNVLPGRALVNERYDPASAQR